MIALIGGLLIGMWMVSTITTLWKIERNTRQPHEVIGKPQSPSK